MHANVFHAINNPLPHQRASVTALHNLYEGLKNHPTLQTKLPGVMHGKEYGIKNVHEFVSEGLSNPEFQYKLSRIRYDGTTAHDSKLAKKLGIPQKIGKEFASATKKVKGLPEKVKKSKSKV